MRGRCADAATCAIAASATRGSGVAARGERASEIAELNSKIGIRVRWIREAYEKREPFRHSQAQWARALKITPEMMNRIELGKSIPLDVILRIIYRSGACVDYVFWGVLDRRLMLDWLYLSLLADHRADLTTVDRFLKIRSTRLQRTKLGGPARNSGRGRAPYVPRKDSSS
jgi:hypothetical protein